MRISSEHGPIWACTVMLKNSYSKLESHRRKLEILPASTKYRKSVYFKMQAPESHFHHQGI